MAELQLHSEVMNDNYIKLLKHGRGQLSYVANRNLNRDKRDRLRFRKLCHRANICSRWLACFRVTYAEASSIAPYSEESKISYWLYF